MKSDVSQLLDLGERILRDAAAKCYTATVADWPRDLTRIRSRVEHEGLSFLTITLPTLGACFETCLAKGSVDSTDFSGFSKSGCLPKLLRGFTSLVFEQNGKLKEEPDVAAIEGVRQVAYSFKKILRTCTPEREASAISSYLDVEQALDAFALSADTASMFGDFCRMLWGNVVGSEISLPTLVPRHGPGATCERIKGNNKFTHRTWHDRLQPYFPFDETAYYNTLAGSQMLEHVEFVPETDEMPVRVILVPKTLKTPRVIAIEPVCMQYTQQAISRYLIEKLENHWITAGHINFTDQSINQRLAISGSQTGLLATLDLSAASDWVPLSEVERMLECNPDLLGALLATRSTRATTLDHPLVPKTTVVLKKFASMGSATCFPIEAMYFFSVIAFALWRSNGFPLTLRAIYNLTRNVYVYGDDLIVPVDQVEVILNTLQEFACKVGYHKSFWTGKFRESCGVEAYDGEVVTPTYIRRVCPENERDASEILSWVATSNLFYKKGYWLTAAYMRERVESVVGKLPLVLDSSPGIGWFSYQGAYSVHRWSKDLHRYEVRTLVPSPVYERDDIGGPIPALTKCLLSYETGGDVEQGLFPRTTVTNGRLDKWLMMTTDPEKLLMVDAQSTHHLRYTARHGAVKLKRRWVSPT